MPYRVRHGTGKRPFQIINMQTGKVVGTSTSRELATRSISHRTEAETSKNIKEYKRKVDNKMPYYGETDLGKKTIRINKSKKKNNKPGDILDTITHEKEHILHPLKHEKTVRKDTALKIVKMSRKQKQKHYNLFKG